jgi:CRP/FNR family transcriptional regulator, cyclic AMP receptor protein
MSAATLEATKRRFPSRTVALVDAAPDLCAGLSPEQRAAARDLVVETKRLWPGAWRATEGADVGHGHLGLLLLDGVMSRELHVAGIASAELLGPGDLVRPWRWDAGDDLLPIDARWSVLSPATVALLDRRVASELSRWPEIIRSLLDCIAWRSERVATTQAIAQLTGVDRRILALFLHLAERWGRPTGDGVVVPLVLTHRLLGQLVGACRPTISAALKTLAERGELLRRRDGSWLLPGAPPLSA